MKLRILPLPETAQVLARLEKLSKGFFREEYLSSVKTISELALLAAKRATPGSGALRDLWSLDIRDRQKFVEFLIYNRAEKTLKKDNKGQTVLDYLEFGTKPHRIYARNAKALRFLLNRLPVFAKFVRHPGTKPYGMVKAAELTFLRELKKVEEEIRRKVEKSFSLE